ncbi:hypothetical protein Tco_0659163 [Tanacetum coccineum]
MLPVVEHLKGVSLLCELMRVASDIDCRSSCTKTQDLDRMPVETITVADQVTNASRIHNRNPIAENTPWPLQTLPGHAPYSNQQSAFATSGANHTTACNGGQETSGHVKGFKPVSKFAVYSTFLGGFDSGSHYGGGSASGDYPGPGLGNYGSSMNIMPPSSGGGYPDAGNYGVSSAYPTQRH